MTERAAWRTLLGGEILLGLGLGGFFDGIAFHQILQWHHMLTSAGYPATTIRNLEVNTLADGLFHAATYLLTGVGLTLLWHVARHRHEPWPARVLAGAGVLGWGLFNTVEGLVDHYWLRIHHVKSGPHESLFDLLFLAWGLAMIIGGWLILRGSADRSAAASG